MQYQKLLLFMEIISLKIPHVEVMMVEMSQEKWSQ
jgi:hypothetical protein